MSYCGLRVGGAVLCGVGCRFYPTICITLESFSQMATGLSTQLTRQIGEHLVTAELGRRKVIATPFAGNVPSIDILAFANGISALIQVKAINGTDWQFDLRSFLDVTQMEKEKGQKVNGLNQSMNRQIICIFVAVGENLGEDTFYIFKLGWLQDHFHRTNEGRQPPKNIKSFHCAISKKEIKQHLGKWSVIEHEFKL